MTRKAATRAGILKAFLRLANERGIDSTSMKAVADAAEVSELTVFRHFGDKQTLAREAIRHAAPIERLGSFVIDFDVSILETAVAGITACLCFLRDATLRSGGLLQFALAEARRHPELSTELMAAPLVAQSLIDRALGHAARHLQPGLDRKAATLTLQGMLLLTLTWTSIGWMKLSRREWDQLLADAVRLVIRESSAWKPTVRKRRVARMRSR